MSATDARYALLAGHAAAALENELVAESVILGPWDHGDPWGSAMGARFALNDALGLYGGETDETYSPGASPLTVLEEETAGGPELLEALESGAVTVEALERADRWLDLLTDRLTSDGRDY